jgi:Na+/melibiose symporter-like transporter
MPLIRAKLTFVGIMVRAAVAILIALMPAGTAQTREWLVKGIIYIFIAAMLFLVLWGLTRLKPTKPKPKKVRKRRKPKRVEKKPRPKSVRRRRK